MKEDPGNLSKTIVSRGKNTHHYNAKMNANYI